MKNVKSLHGTVALACAWWPRARTLEERLRVLRELRARATTGYESACWASAVREWARMRGEEVTS